MSDTGTGRPAVLELRGVSKVYGQTAAGVHALRDATLSVEAGSVVAVMYAVFAVYAGGVALFSGLGDDRWWGIWAVGGYAAAAALAWSWPSPRGRRAPLPAGLAAPLPPPLTCLPPRHPPPPAPQAAPRPPVPAPRRRPARPAPRGSRRGGRRRGRPRRGRGWPARPP